jgi:hypothetical protein
LSSSTLKVTRRSSRRTQLLQRIILRRKNARSSEYADALVWPRRSRAAIKGRGRLAITLTSLLLKAGANPIVQCKMAAGCDWIVVFRVTAGHFIAANTMTRNGRRCSLSCALAARRSMSVPTFMSLELFLVDAARVSFGMAVPVSRPNYSAKRRNVSGEVKSRPPFACDRQVRL